MKNLIKSSFLSLAFVLGLNANEIIQVGAVPVPHAEILEVARPILKEKGYELKITEIDDKVLNYSLESGDIDANFYQHEPFLKDFNAQNGTHLISLAKVHIEPMAIYSTNHKNLNELKSGAKVSIPNDPINEKRALILLDKAGLIEFDDEKFEITSNPKNLQITTLLAATLPRSINDVDISIISTSYALAGGLNPLKDGLFVEEKDSPYVNIIAIRKSDENSTKLNTLKDAITSEQVKEFINSKYDGVVLPAF